MRRLQSTRGNQPKKKEAQIMRAKKQETAHPCSFYGPRHRDATHQPNGLFFLQVLREYTRKKNKTEQKTRAGEG